MRTQPTIRARRRLSASLLLAVLLFRAYVPIGFMPAGGSPFLLALCPDGLPAAAQIHHQHHQPSQGHAHFEHCPFGSAPAAGPMSTLLAVLRPAPVSSEILAPEARSPHPVRLSPAHAPRGPPALA